MPFVPSFHFVAGHIHQQRPTAAASGKKEFSNKPDCSGRNLLQIKTASKTNHKGAPWQHDKLEAQRFGVSIW